MYLRLLCFIVACFGYSSASSNYYTPVYLAPCTIHAFGDSLTDGGVDVNHHHGFKIFSNGPVWPTHLARYLGCGDENSENTKIFGYSGAFSGQGNYYFKGWSGLLWQVDQYVKYNSHNPYSTIVAYECGGWNDLIKAAEDNIDDKAFGKLQDTIVLNNMNALRKLIKSGVKNFIVLELVEFVNNGPFVVQDWYKAKADIVNKTVLAINEQLRNEVTSYFMEAYPYIRMVQVDTSGLWAEFAEKYPITDKAFDHHNEEGTHWQDWKNYIWFDDYHTLTHIQKDLARKAYETWMQPIKRKPYSA